MLAFGVLLAGAVSLAPTAAADAADGPCDWLDIQAWWPFLDLHPECILPADAGDGPCSILYIRTTPPFVDLHHECLPEAQPECLEESPPKLDQCIND